MRTSEAKRQTQGPIFASEEEFRDARVEDMRHVAAEAKEFHDPVQVVRDNKLLKEFLEAEGISAQETGLGRRRRDEPRGLERLQEINVDFDGNDIGIGNKLALGVGVGCGLGALAWWALQRQASSTQEQARPQSRQAQTKYRIPVRTARQSSRVSAIGNTTKSTMGRIIPDFFLSPLG